MHTRHAAANSRNRAAPRACRRARRLHAGLCRGQSSTWQSSQQYLVEDRPGPRCRHPEHTRRAGFAHLGFVHCMVAQPRRPVVSSDDRAGRPAAYLSPRSARQSYWQCHYTQQGSECSWQERLLHNSARRVSDTSGAEPALWGGESRRPLRGARRPLAGRRRPRGGIHRSSVCRGTILARRNLGRLRMNYELCLEEPDVLG